MFAPFKKEHICIAHRGYRAYFPENTLFAFQAALGRFDMFEFDVQYTKDMVPVIFHDEDLLRCTNVKEMFDKYTVRELTFDEIKRLDNVSWFIKQNPFNTDLDYGYLNTIPKHSIPTLDEVLEFIKQNRFPANLEIKNSDLDAGFIVGDVLSRVEKHGVKDYVIISSFNHDYVRKIEGFYKAALFDGYKEGLLDYLKDLKVDSYHVDVEHLKTEDIQVLLKSGIFTNVYTVDDEKLKLKLFDQGVKGIFCDY